MIDDQQATERMPAFSQDSDMKDYLYELLASYYQIFEAHEVNQQNAMKLRAQVEALKSAVGRTGVVTQFMRLTYECMDLLIQDANYKRYEDCMDDAEDLCSSDDGLILSNIETKAKKLSVIERFAREFDLNAPESTAALDDLMVKLNVAHAIRNH